MLDAALTPVIFDAAAFSLREYLPSSFSLKLWSAEADQAWERQWKPISLRRPPNGGWDWPSCRIAGAGKPSQIFAAMWSRRETELCGLLLLRINKTACQIAMVEGSPDPHHSLRGIVLLVALELASMCAQKTGRRDVWVAGPISDMIMRHLLTDYGLELVRPRKGTPFCRREV